MKYLKTTFLFVLICMISFGQESSVIDYPFSTVDKSFSTIKKSKDGLSYKNRIVVSSDGKYGIWFIEGKNVHFYNVSSGDWELFDNSNGLFNGEVGVIYHDSKGNTWMGSALGDYALDGYAAIRISGEGGGGVCLYDGNRLTLYEKHDLKMQSPEISNFSEGPNGGTYVSTGITGGGGVSFGLWPGGLFMFKDGQWHDYSKGKVKCPIKYIERLNLDYKNNLWMASSNELCYFNGDKFIKTKIKINQQQNPIYAFGKKNTWVSTGDVFHQYNYSTEKFDKIQKYKSFPTFKPIVLGDNLVCFFMTDKNPQFSSVKKDIKRAKTLTIRLIDQGRIISSLDQDIAKDLFFATAATINDNKVLLGTNKGIVMYSNGEFYRNDDFNLVNEKSVKSILVSQNKWSLIICNKIEEKEDDEGESYEVYFYDANLSALNWSEDPSYIKSFETSSGDLILSTKSNVYLVKSVSGNQEVIKLAGDLIDCTNIFEFNKKLFLICPDEIRTVSI